jgi:ATP-dependent RNA helicase RhlE
VFIVPKSEKLKLIKTLLQEYKGTVLIFSRTKYGAKNIAQKIRSMGHTATEIHSNRSLAQRKQSLQGFKNGEFRILVATDIASRGIDVTDIELVINYDLPDNPDDYVHRIGRTARAGSSGKAISFVVPEQKRDLNVIERLVRTKIPVGDLPEGIDPKAKGPDQAKRPGESEKRFQTGRGRSGGRSGGFKRSSSHSPGRKRPYSGRTS